jgi:hypothetical protein
VIWSDRSPQRDQHSIPGWRRVVPWQGIDLARRRIDKNWRALAQLAHYRDMHRWSGPRHAATLASAVQYSVICDYDKRGLPDPLALTFHFSPRGDEIVQLIILRNHAGI